MQSDENDTFGEAQNEPAQLRYILARRQVQSETTRLLIFQVMMVVVIPVGLAMLSFYVPCWKPYTALVALVIALTDIVLIDRVQKAWLAKSAKLQEAFDCRIFRLSWNAFVAGAQPADSFVASKAAAYERTGREHTALGWYPERLSVLPSHLGRIAAQTVNMLYDEWLRTHYRILVGLAVVLVLMLIMLLAGFEHLNLTTVLLGVLVPTAPLINWCAREVFRQHDALKRLRATRLLNEELWDSALAGRVSSTEAEVEARHVQDVSYIRRSTSPAIFEHLYWVRRHKLELRMNAKADEMVRSAQHVPATDS